MYIFVEISCKFTALVITCKRQQSLSFHAFKELNNIMMWKPLPNGDKKRISSVWTICKMKRRNRHYIVCICVLVYIFYVFGVSDYLHARSYELEFDYPLNIDIRPLVDEVLLGKKPSVAPINFYPYRFLSNSGKCSTLEKLDLFIVVKTAMNNFDRRHAIRSTFGSESANQGRIVKTLFFVGVDFPKSATQKRIDQEMEEFKDIIQIDFHDNYQNNTIKTMMSFRWLYEHCAVADHYFFTDDDMYVSIENLFDYVDGGTVAGDRSEEVQENRLSSKGREGLVYAGYMFRSSPQRFRSSKWRVSLQEYPWDRWPPYVTAGAYVLSNKAMKMMYAGSLFVKNFRFDDIYLGIVAKKVGLPLTHCDKFFFYKKSYSIDGYKDVIASHGYGDPEELIKVWNYQNVMLPILEIG